MKEENNNLSTSNLQESGEIACSIHGGDHSATILTDPNNPNVTIYRCNKTGEEYQ